MSDPGGKLDDVLAEFEQRLTQLHEERRLTNEAPAAFRAFRNEVERRLKSDRRAQHRPGSDRRAGSETDQHDAGTPR